MALNVSQIVLEFVVPTAGAASPLVLADSPPSGTVGKAYSHCFIASGGTPPYVSYGLTAGSLPPGLTLSASGCAVGIPLGPPGTFCFTVTVTDSAAATASVDACITIVGVVWIQLIGWKLYPESPCGDSAEVLEIPKVDRAV